MEPFYVDPKSPFVPLVQALVNRIGDSSNNISLASFSQTVPQFVQSPQLLKSGVAKEVATVVPTIRIQAKSADPNKWADTDFKEALSTVTAALPTINDQKEGIVWLITNNKNSPNNDANTLKRNIEYYDFLHKTPEFKRILAWPLKMPEQLRGKLYSASGLMIYAFAHGDQSDALLQRMASSTIKSLLNEPPARLKPQNADAVLFVPTKPTDGTQKNTHSVTLALDGRTILMSVDAAQYSQTATLHGKFINAFNLYDIQTATLNANYGGISLQVAPNQLKDLRAGASSPVVSFSINIPPLKSAWSPEILTKPSATYSGQLEVNLQQELVPSLQYQTRFKEIFPGDPLPDIFKPAQSSTTSTTKLPMRITIQYPAWPLAVLGGLGFALLAGIVGLWLYARQEKRFNITVDGSSRSMLIKAFQTVAVRGDNGQVIAQLKRGFGTLQTLSVAENHHVTVRS
jgi:hypothetical protein